MLTDAGYIYISGRPVEAKMGFRCQVRDCKGWCHSNASVDPIVSPPMAHCQLQQTSMNNVRIVSRKVDMSKSAVHRVMRDVLGYKPYKVQLTQQLYDEDKDLRVEKGRITDTCHR